jgi:hypothetical protein
MSVINKMLRDLDSRNARAAIKKVGVHSVPAMAVRDRRVVSVASGSAVKVLGAILAMVLVGVGVWKSGLVSPWLESQPSAVAVVPSPVPLPSVAPSSAPASVPAAAASNAASAPAALPASAPLAPASSVSNVPAPAVMPVASAPTSKPLPVLAAASAPQVPASAVKPAASSPSPAFVLAPVPAKPVASASGVPMDAQRQQTAAEAVATAQSLWNAGSRESAIRLLGDVLLSAERSMAGNASAPLGAGLLALVRELTRMQLADGRPGAAWDVLVRLESHVRNEADLWAVRGNAAQRLGRHADSVLAYMAALQLRPTEQRWMLGAAVSLAAAGKAEEAAGMVEKAQAAGPISSEVQAYLRQMGVQIKD